MSATATLRRVFLAVLFCLATGGVFAVPQVTVLTYNVSGNGTTNWSTNTPQAQAIGRELLYLNPDIITFQEIPFTNTWQMPNWVTAFMPGYFLATNSGTDGYLRSVIASRFPINRSKSWMSRSNLTYFGYNGPFTRDLFEAEIAVPGFAQPLHVFTTHLKAGTDTTSQQRRAAESAAISNFLVTVFLPTNLAPYLLTGDMNEDLIRSANPQALANLTRPPTGLQLTTPTNPVSGSELTISIQSGLFSRYDYILPGPLLASNLVGSQVFRTDLLTNLPANLFSNDDATASDHLPVVMTFANPYTRPFTVTKFSRSNNAVNLQWGAVPGGRYRVESSTNLASWTVLLTNLLTTNYTGSLNTNTSEAVKFFRVCTQ